MLKHLPLLSALPLLMGAVVCHAETYTCPAGDKVIHSDTPCGKVGGGAERQAQIYKCTAAGKVTYGDVPCRPGTGGAVALTYDAPTPEQIEAYRADLKRRSDDADARLQAWAIENAINEEAARKRQLHSARMRREEESRQFREAQQRRLDAIDWKLKQLNKPDPNLYHPMGR